MPHRARGHAASPSSRSSSHFSSRTGSSTGSRHRGDARTRTAGRLALLLLALFCTPAASFALPVGHQVLYDVDFGSAIHTVGQLVGTDSGAGPRRGPSRVVFGDPMVVAGHGELADQPLLFAGNASSVLPSSRYDQIQFDVAGVHDQLAMSFDLLVSGPPGGGALGTPSLSLFVDRSGGISRIDFLPDGSVRHWNAALSSSALWFRHQADRAHHYELLVDLDAGRLTLARDDVQYVLALGPTAAGRDGSIMDLRFSSIGAAGQAVAALDNVVISALSMPEPGTALLLAVGLALTARRQRPKRRAC